MEHQTPEWNSGQLLTIEDHIQFHNNYIAVLNKMKADGPSQSEKLPKFPTQPKRKLSDLYGQKTKKAKTVMLPNELHEYLKSKMVNVGLKVRKEVFFFNLDDITSSATAIEKLFEGYKQMKKQEATSMGFNLQYGCVLETAFKFFEAEERKGMHNDTWNNWLKTNVGICPSYAWKLREMFRLLKPYMSKFSTVGLSFYEVFSKKAELKSMFESSEQIRNFWREVVVSIVTDDQQQSSQ